MSNWPDPFGERRDVGSQKDDTPVGKWWLTIVVVVATLIMLALYAGSPDDGHTPRPSVSTGR